MASRISYKQMQEDIRNYIGGQVFLKVDKVSDYEIAITIDANDVKEHNGNTLPKLQKEDLKLIQIIDNDNILVGIAFVNSYNQTTDEYEIIAVEYGKGNFNIFKSTVKLTKTIDAVDTLNFTDIVAGTLTINDLSENQLVYDEDGTVSRIISINTATNKFDTKVITLAGAGSTDRLTSNTALNTIIGGTTTLRPVNLGMTVVTDVKLNQLVYDTDGTVGYISNTDAVLNEITIVTMTKSVGKKTVRYKSNKDLDDKILNQSTINFTDLVVASGTVIGDLEVAQLVYDKNGTVAIIDSINTANGEIKVTTITTKGETFVPEFYRYNKTLNTTIDTTQLILFTDLNVPTSMSISDLEIGQIIFDEDATVSKIESIDTINSEVMVRIITRDTIPTPIKVYKITETLELDVDAQKLVNIPAGITDVKVDQLVYDNEGTVAKIINVDTTLGKMMVQTITGIGMPTAPDHKEPKIRKGGSNYAVGDIIETTTTGTFVKVTQVDANGVLVSVAYEPTATSASTANGTDAEIDYEQVIYGGYGKNWYQLADAAVLVAQTIAEGFVFEQGYEYEITNAGTGYSVGDVLADAASGKNIKVTQIGTSGEILAVAYTRNTTLGTSGTGATITSTPSDDVFIIPDSRWNIGTALFTITNDDGASVQFLRTDNILTKYNAGKDTIYKFTFDNVDGVIIQEKTSLNGSGVIYVTTLPTNATTMLKDILYVSEEGYCITNDNVNIHTSDFSNELKEYSTFTAGDKIKKNTTITKDKILYRATSDITVSAWSTDKTKLEEIKTDSAIIGGFIPNRYYAQNETIIEDNLVYSRITAGVSGASLGADIQNWKLVTKLHSSGNRYVRFQIPKPTEPAGTWHQIQNLTYVDGDSSMVTNKNLIAPVDGLYYFTISAFKGLSAPTPASTPRTSFTQVCTEDTTNTIASSTSYSNYETRDVVTGFYRMKAGDKLNIRCVYSTMPNVQGSVSEFGLISDDNSDNLIAEAEMNMCLPTSNTSYRETFSNSTNPSVINNNGDITLPEDGSYIIDTDALNTSGITTADRHIYIRDYDTDRIVASNVIPNTASLLIPSMTKVISGKKGKKFYINILSLTANSTSTVTKLDNPKIRIFKIKSTNLKLTSKDFYADYVEEHKNDPSYMSYEEWVIRKYNQDNLTVTAKAVIGQNFINDKNLVKFNYESGESDLLQDNKFVAPVSGYYQVELAPLYYGTQSCNNSVVIVKNGTSAREWESSVAYSRIADDTWSPSLSKSVWLDKDEWVVIKARPYANVSIVDGDANYNSKSLNRVTFTLLHTGTPEGNINFPNTWEKNKKIYLGNDLYGYRAYGTITLQAGRLGITDLINDGSNNNYQLVSCGGWWSCYGTDVHEQVGASRMDDSGNLICSSSITTSPSNAKGIIRFHSTSSQNRTDAEYDIWVTFTEN